jgi:hypothetical protein
LPGILFVNRQPTHRGRIEVMAFCPTPANSSELITKERKVCVKVDGFVGHRFTFKWGLPAPRLSDICRLVKAMRMVTLGCSKPNGVAIALFSSPQRLSDFGDGFSGTGAASQTFTALGSQRR